MFVLRNLYSYFFYPGYRMIVRYRWSHWLRKRTFLIPLSKILWLRNVHQLGCYISEESEIGKDITLPHAVGIVIGAGVRIGNGVTIYQHVTIGRKNFNSSLVPCIGDNVIIYAGAVVVGGITIGKGSVIGANSVILSDVPENGIAIGRY